MKSIYQVIFRDKKTNEVTDRYNLCRDASKKGFLSVAAWGEEQCNTFEYPAEITQLAVDGQQ